MENSMQFKQNQNPVNEKTKIYKCEICDKEFKNNDGLRHHFNNVHNLVKGTNSLANSESIQDVRALKEDYKAGCFENPSKFLKSKYGESYTADANSEVISSRIAEKQRARENRSSITRRYGNIETPKEISFENESEEDDNTTDEQRKARQYRKRKAQPGWNVQNHVFTGPENPEIKLYKDPNDGMTYEYDNEKKAWFPRINEDFMAQYQMNYGFTKDGQAEPTRPSEEIEPQKNVESEHSDPKKSAKEIKKPQWFEHDSEKSTKVYVSLLPDGAPDDDWNEDEFVKFMSKCGVLDIDVRTNKPKAKLYKDEEGNFKGDGLCTYLKVESVQLALTILDGSCIKPGQAIKVEKAKFELKGNYNPKLKPKKLSKKEQERAKKRHEKMLAWEPDKLRGERTKRDKVIGTQLALKSGKKCNFKSTKTHFSQFQKWQKNIFAPEKSLKLHFW